MCDLSEVCKLNNYWPHHKATSQDVDLSICCFKLWKKNRCQFDTLPQADRDVGVCYTQPWNLIFFLSRDYKSHKPFLILWLRKEQAKQSSAKLRKARFKNKLTVYHLFAAVKLWKWNFIEVVLFWVVNPAVCQKSVYRLIIEFYYWSSLKFCPILTAYQLWRAVKVPKRFWLQKLIGG